MTGPELVGFRVQAPDTSPLLNCLMHRPLTNGQVDDVRGAIATAEFIFRRVAKQFYDAKWHTAFPFLVKLSFERFGPVPEQWPLP